MSAAEAVPLHPLAELCFASLREDGGELVWAPEGQTRVAAAFRAYFGKPEVKAATLELVVLAFFLESKRRAAGLARALIEIAQSAIPSLRQLNVSFEGLLSSQDARRRLELLGHHEHKLPVAQRPRAPGSKRFWEMARK